MSLHGIVLPPELIAKIIDELRDKRDFLSCSLVHSTWHPRARDNLFQWIEIHLLPSKATRYRFNSLVATILEKPELASRVRTFFVTGSDPDFVQPLGRDDDDRLLQVRDVSERIAQILPLFYRIRKVTIDDLLDESCTGWQSTALVFRSAMFDLFAQPATKEIYISSVDGIPLVPLMYCANLETLWIKDVSGDPTEGDAPYPMPLSYPTKSSFVGLRSLSLGAPAKNTAMVLECLVHEHSSLSLKNLQRLTIATCLSPSAESAFLRLADICKDALTSYVVHQAKNNPYSNDIDDSVFPGSLVRFHTFSNLRDLEVDLEHHLLENLPGHQNLILSVVGALDVLGHSPNVLETFRVHITYQDQHGFQAQSTSISIEEKYYEQWCDLDAVLSRGRFPSLSVAHVCLDYRGIYVSQRPAPALDSRPEIMNWLAQMKTLVIYEWVPDMYGFEKAYVPRGPAFELVVISGSCAPLYFARLGAIEKYLQEKRVEEEFVRRFRFDALLQPQNTPFE